MPGCAMTGRRGSDAPVPPSAREIRSQGVGAGTSTIGSQPVQVIAGVLQDARGRVLLARRTQGRDLAGLWEFPGGKREPGESAEGALKRELREELGIACEIGAELICVPHRYPHKRLRLDVRRVLSWQGTPRGREGQALAWAPPHALASYDMPAADRPVVAALLQPDRYLVTPPPDDGAQWLSSVQLALDGGIRRVQLRGLASAGAGANALARTVVERCRAVAADVLVNGDIALARALGVGVHLRASQLAELEKRPLADGCLLAASCHDAEGLLRAEQLGCDFVVLGPVAATQSHPGQPGIGWDAFARMREQVSLPIYAIGGMTPGDIARARSHGAQGIAAIRSLWPGEPVQDPN